MRAAPLALLVALALPLAACDSATDVSCPGEPVASLSFSGRLVAAGDPAVAALDPVPALPDCDAAAFGFPDPVAFDGTFASAGTGPGGTLCRPNGQTLLGTRSGDRWRVEHTSTGAVLEGCGATCAASSRSVISGDLLRDAGAPAGFAGALVEVLTANDPACGACVLPCAARYALDGTVVGG